MQQGSLKSDQIIFDVGGICNERLIVVSMSCLQLLSLCTDKKQRQTSVTLHLPC